MTNTPYPSLGIAGGRFAKHSLPHLAEEGFVDPSRLQDFSRKVSRVKIGNPNWILVGSLFTRNTLEIKEIDVVHTKDLKSPASLIAL